MVRTKWSSVLLVLLLVAAVKGQMLHSIDRLTAAIENQAMLADQLQEYVQQEEKRLQQISLTIDKLRTSSVNKRMEKAELEKEMSHPVRVLRFVGDIYSNVESAVALIDQSLATEGVNDTLDLLPTHTDYVDVVRAVIRLQEVYGEAADFSMPQGNNTKDVLTAEEVFEIGRVCVEQRNLYSAINNFQRAKKMFEEEDNMPRAMEAYDYLAYAMHEQDNPEYALNYTYDLLEYYRDKDSATAERLSENIDIYIDTLGGPEKAKELVKLLNPYTNIPHEQFNNYNELCRGESIEAPNKDRGPLKCYFYTNNDHPLLILSPARKEDLNTKTGLSFFHDVLTDREIKLLQEKASKKFEDSQLVPDDSVREDPDLEVGEDDQSYADIKVRSSNTGWVDDEDDSMVLAISKRIAAILSLSLDSAESFQVLSYGIGGFYLPHFDWGSGDHPFEGFEGNRIATWIFYLNNIKKGGATVFPDIGATVWPEKGGAAFWRNLYRNGTGDPLTLHAACPVLEGYKWASNKWFHTVGNELSWPCDVNPEQ